MDTWAEREREGQGRKREWEKGRQTDRERDRDGVKEISERETGERETEKCVRERN